MNDALRRGLAAEENPKPEAVRFATPSVSLGRPSVPNLDHVVEGMAQHESAKAWLDEKINGFAPVGLPLPCLLGFQIGRAHV